MWKIDSTVDLCKKDFMIKILFRCFLVFSCIVAAAPRYVHGENVSGKWETSCFFNRMLLDVINEGDSLWGVLYLHSFAGEVSTYHFTGSISEGNVEARHHSGHAFQGRVERNIVEGTLTTRTGMRIPLYLDDLRRVP